LIYVQVIYVRSVVLELWHMLRYQPTHTWNSRCEAGPITHNTVQTGDTTLSRRKLVPAHARPNGPLTLEAKPSPRRFGTLGRDETPTSCGSSSVCSTTSSESSWSGPGTVRYRYAEDSSRSFPCARSAVDGSHSSHLVSAPAHGVHPSAPVVKPTIRDVRQVCRNTCREKISSPAKLAPAASLSTCHRFRSMSVVDVTKIVECGAAGLFLEPRSKVQVDWAHGEATPHGDHEALTRGDYVGENCGCPSDFYDIAERIGEGIFGVVTRVRCRYNGDFRCMKTVKKHRAVELGMAAECVVNEAKALRTLDHPCILRLFEYYTDTDTVYLITDFLQGATLFAVIIEQIFALAPVKEPWARDVFRQLCEGVAYAHGKGVMHKDLKLDNVMVSTSNPPQAVVIDWGFAEVFPASEADTYRSGEWGGTISTMAPEVLLRSFTCRCDVWSLGCCLWGLLCKQPTAFRKPSGELEFYPYPFTPPEGRSNKEISEYLFQMYCGPDYANFGGSQEAHDLLVSMLRFDHLRRPRLQEVLSHPWFTSFVDRTVSDDELHSLIDFAHRGTPAQSALLEAASRLPRVDLLELGALFRSIQETDGVVRAERLAKVMQCAGTESSVAHTAAAQLASTGPVEFSLFVAAVLESDSPP